MEVLNINNFLSFKNNPELQQLDTVTLKQFAILFPNADKYKRNKKNNKQQSTQLLKNQKLQSKKELVVNRVNLILNKLSESNIENLVLEFIENINQIDKEDWDETIKTIYLKILSEINFVKVYLQFVSIISYLYNRVQKHSFEYFINLVETKFAVDYLNYDTNADPKYDFIEDFSSNEQKRINNMILIKSLVEYKFLNNSIIKDCSNKILQQNLFLSDIYHWFSTFSINVDNNTQNIIKNHLKLKDIGTREKVLLENLIGENKSIEKINNNVIEIKKSITKPVNTLILETDNILDEYIELENQEDVVYFIENRCPDAITKNKFCEYVIDKYMNVEDNNKVKLLELLKNLIKTNILYKSNLSRGLLMTQDLSIKPIDRLKMLLTTMKSIGITKGLESLMAIHKI